MAAMGGSIRRNGPCHDRSYGTMLQRWINGDGDGGGGI